MQDTFRFYCYSIIPERAKQFNSDNTTRTGPGYGRMMQKYTLCCKFLCVSRITIDQQTVFQTRKKRKNLYAKDLPASTRLAVNGCRGRKGAEKNI